MSRPHRLLWFAGAPARAVLIGGIRVYRATLSGAFGNQCRFYPSCSHYAEDAVRLHGAAKGSAMALWRILRCNPFGKGGLEPAPPRRVDAPRCGEAYDEVIQRHEGART